MQKKIKVAFLIDNNNNWIEKYLKEILIKKNKSLVLFFTVTINKSKIMKLFSFLTIQKYLIQIS